MKADEVARYLKDNPIFFEDYADLLAEIYVPHPHGGHAIPLSERQILTLRDRARGLEFKLAELIKFGEENDAISEKLHRLTIALINARDLPDLVCALHLCLREEFLVPQAALRIWAATATEHSDMPEFNSTSEELHRFAASLEAPFCGANAGFEAAGWLTSEGEIRSVAFVVLRHTKAPVGVIGMLALGSEDAQRFYPEMGTLYLKRLGEIISSAFARFL